MKRYELFNNDPIKFADYVVDKLENACIKIARITGHIFVDDGLKGALRGQIIGELFEEIEDGKNN